MHSELARVLVGMDDELALDRSLAREHRGHEGLELGVAHDLLDAAPVGLLGLDPEQAGGRGVDRDDALLPSTASTPSVMPASTASRSLRSSVIVWMVSLSRRPMAFRPTATSPISSASDTWISWLKSPAAKRSAPRLMARMRPEMLRETSRPSSATAIAAISAPSAMRLVMAAIFASTWASGSAVRITAFTWWSASKTGIAT